MGRLVVFVGGFGDKTFQGPVARYAREFGNRNNGFDTRYFAWHQRGKILLALREAQPGQKTVLVGHSYGADTALKLVIDKSCQVDLLVTIDPVGRFGRPAYENRPATAQCLNVSVKPSAFSPLDLVAAVGGRYPALPADINYIWRGNHWGFAEMMRLGTPSAEELIGLR